jgi:hypothetical protein
MTTRLLDIIEKMAILMIGFLSLISLNCEKDNAINSRVDTNIDNQVFLTDDKYEPNNSRLQSYILESIPYQGLEGVLTSKDDIDWFKFSITDKDSCEIKLTFDMTKMTEQFGVQGCLYDKTEVPKGCFKLYKGLNSDALSSFGWEGTVGDYYFFIKVDTSYEKDIGKYCINITK